MLRKARAATAAMACVIMAALSGCSTTMPIAQQSGKADVGYLIVASAGKNVNRNVNVDINDGDATFRAKTIKQKNTYSKGTAYQLSTGKKRIKITRNGKKLYDGNIIINQQDTKVVLIP